MPIRTTLSTALFIATIAVYAGAAEPQKFQITPEENELAAHTNAQRQQQGLQPLKVDPRLMQAARQHSQAMARQKILSHQIGGSGPDDRVKATGYKYFKVGENIGWNEPTPEAAVKGWMKSPGHRENILTKEFTEIGVGIARGENDQPFYTQVFARPQSAGPTAQATFSIINESTGDVSIELPGDSPQSVLQHGEKAMFSISSGGSELPKITIRGENMERQIGVADGTEYIVEPTEAGIDVRAEQPAR